MNIKRILYTFQTYIIICVFTFMSIIHTEAYALTDIQKNLITAFKDSGKSGKDLTGYLKSQNITAKSLMESGYTIADFKALGLTATELKDLGIDAAYLKSQDVSLDELKDLGFSAQELQSAGYTVNDLKAAGHSIQDIINMGFTISEISKTKAFPAAELKAAGVSISDLLSSGYSKVDIIQANFSPNQLVQAGFTASDFKAANYPAFRLKDSGIPITELKNAGYSAVDLSNIANFSELKSAGFNASQLKGAGAKASELKALGYSAAELKSAGFDAYTLKKEGIALSELQSIYSVPDLKLAGFTLKDMINAQINSSELVKHFSISELITGGINLAQLKTSGATATQLKQNGATLNDLIDAGYTSTELSNTGYSIKELHDAGVTPTELKSTGATIEQLKDILTTNELKQAGFSDQEILSSGKSIKDLVDSGLSLKSIIDQNLATTLDLINSGFDVSQIRGDAELPLQKFIDDGVSITTLKPHYTLRNFIDSGVAIKELLAAGFTISQLKSEGVTASQFKDTSLTTKNLIDSGYTANELIQAKFGLNELIQNGTSIRDLQEAGIETKDLIDANISVKKLLDNDISIKELINNGVSSSDIISAGKTKKQIIDSKADLDKLVKDKAITTKDLIDNGVNSGELFKAGVPVKEIVQNNGKVSDLVKSGAKTTELLNAGVSAVDLTNFGVPAIDLFNAGQNAAQLKEAKVTTNQLLSSGATVENLKKAGFSKDEVLSGGAPQSEVDSVFKTIELPQDNGDDSEGDSPTDPTGSLDDLIRGQLASSILNDGDACIEESQAIADANNCRSKGSVWNCEASICYTNEYRNQVIDEGMKCYESSEKAKQDECIDKVKTDTVREIATGKLCDLSSKEAIECGAKAMEWNCNINICLSPEQNKSVGDKYAGCYEKTDATERKACLDSAQDELIDDYVHSCDISTNDKAKECNLNEKTVWNCVASSCLTKDFDNKVTTDGKKCLVLETELARNHCMDTLKYDTTFHIAKGENCLIETDEAKACQKEGNVWNCNVDYCLTPEQNESFATKATKCEVLADGPEKDLCRDDLTDTLIIGLFTDCEGPKVDECKEKGRVWNCKVKLCLSEADNNRIMNAFKSCTQKDTRSEQKMCFAELDQLANGLSKGGGKQQKIPEKAPSATKAMLQQALAGILLAALTGCASAIIMAIAAYNGAQTEKNSSKQTNAELESLKAEYEALQARNKSQDPSYEMQKEVFEFYLRAIDRLEAVAKKRMKSYSNYRSMMELAKTIAIVELVVFSIACAYGAIPACVAAACAATVIKLSSVGLAALSAALKRIDKALKELGEHRKYIEDLLEKFETLFGDTGALGRDKAKDDPTSIGPTSNSTKQTIASTKANASGTSNDGEELLTKIPPNCVNKQGEIEDNCECAKTNSCKSFEVDFSKLGKVGAFARKEGDLDSLIKLSNQILSGKVDLSTVDQKAISGKIGKLKRIQKFLIKKLNDKEKALGKNITKLPTTEDSLKFFNSDKFQGYIAKAKDSGKLDFLFGKNDVSNFLPTKKNLSKFKGFKKSLSKIKQPAFVPSSSIDFGSIDSLDDFKDEKSELSSGISTSNSEANENENKEEIIHERGKSIFEILSNGYNKAIIKDKI